MERECVTVTLHLGTETYSAVASSNGLISDQLTSVKEQSMMILKDFITKYNIPNEVPDEVSSEDDDNDEDDDQDKSPKLPVKKSKNGQ